MGMFDTIIINAKCPICGDEGEKEFQTKDLECMLNEYRLGDNATNKLKYLDCNFGCKSKTCLLAEELRNKKSPNFQTVGFGTTLKARIFLDENGCITGKYEIDR